MFKSKKLDEVQLEEIIENISERLNRLQIAQAELSHFEDLLTDQLDQYQEMRNELEDDKIS